MKPTPPCAQDSELFGSTPLRLGDSTSSLHSTLGMCATGLLDRVIMHCAGIYFNTFVDIKNYQGEKEPYLSRRVL